MALTVPDICNLALADLGEKRITAIDEATNQARFCRAYYAQTRDVVLRSHPWNFAIAQAELTQDATPPIAHYSHRYALPTDFLRLTQMNDFEAWEPRKEWEVRGGYLHTDAESATIEYVSRIENSALFDPLFVEALAKLLASKLAAPLTNDRQLGVYLRGEYDRLLTSARSTDAQEARPKMKYPWTESPLVRARFGSDIG